MEKLIIITTKLGMHDSLKEPKELKEYLENGYRIKDIKTDVLKEGTHITIVHLTEK